MTRDPGRTTAAPPPDLGLALAQLSSLPPAAAADAARADQDRRWAAGDRVPAEAYLAALPAVAADPDHALVLIYGEVLARTAAGETPGLTEYAARFPHLADRLAVQFDLHAALAAASTNASRTGAYDPNTNDDTPSAGAVSGAGGPAPDRIGPYRVIGELGRGGMGVVYEAEDERLGRTVAVKVIRTAAVGTTDRWAGRTPPEVRARFLREARAAAAVKHDHIVTVYHADEIDGTPFLAMELLAGTSLDRWLAATPAVPVRAVVRVGRETAEALAAAHAKGLVHRDVKPSNLWVEAPSGRTKVLDFGLARAAVVADPAGGSPPNDDAAADPMTYSRAIVGTPGYMAPEQARGERVDGRADLFSLGCVLYRMATGRPAFQGGTVRQLLTAVEDTTPPPARGLNPAVPTALAGLIDRLLAKDPSDRPESAAAVVAELVVVESALAARGRWTRRAALAAVGGSLATGGAWLAFRPRPHPEVIVARPPDPILPTPENPLDALNPDAIPPAEQFDWQPKELLAVIGTHARKHWGLVTTAAYSPDGRRLATGGTDGVVRLYDAVTLREVATTTAHPGGCNAVAFFPAGDRLATCGRWGTWGLTVWDVGGRRMERMATVPGLSAGGVAVSPDGTRLAVNARTGLSVLDVSGPNPRLLADRWQLPHAGGPTGVRFCGGRDHLITVGRDGMVGVWRIDGRAEVWYRKEHAGDVRLAADPAGTVAVTADAGRVIVWDAAGGGASVRRSFQNALDLDAEAPNVVSLSADGSRLAVHTGRKLTLWDLKRLADEPAVTAMPGPAAATALAADGRRAAVAPQSGALAVWDLAAPVPREIDPLPPDHHARPTVLIPQGYLLARRAGDDGWYDLTGRAPTWVRAADFVQRNTYAYPRKFAVTGAGDTLFYGSDALAAIDLTHPDLPVRRAWPLPRGAEAVSTSADGATVVTRDYDGVVRVMKRAGDGWTDAATFPTTRSPLPIRLSADGRWLIADGPAVWDLTGPSPRPVPLPDAIRSARPVLWSTSGDGNTLAAQADDTIRVWDLAGAAPRVAHTLRVEKSENSVAVLSPDGSQVLTLSRDPEYATFVDVYDVRTADRTHRIRFPWGLADVWFAADGRHLITANRNQTAYVLRLRPRPGT